MAGAMMPIEVLVVEDDPGDVLLMREALEESKFLNALNVVSNGIDAMAYLHQEPPYAEQSRPDLVLLDLNLPKKDGREVLAEIKQDPGLRTIPVVVLTTSNADTDIVRSYDLHANLYVTKPVDINRFMEVVQAIDEFFLTVVRLPPR